jgi:hypothetical protein
MDCCRWCRSALSCLRSNREPSAWVRQTGPPRAASTATACRRQNGRKTSPATRATQRPLAIASRSAAPSGASFRSRSVGTCWPGSRAELTTILANISVGGRFRPKAPTTLSLSRESRPNVNNQAQAIVVPFAGCWIERLPDRGPNEVSHHLGFTHQACLVHRRCRLKHRVDDVAGGCNPGG